MWKTNIKDTDEQSRQQSETNNTDESRKQQTKTINTDEPSRQQSETSNPDISSKQTDELSRQQSRTNAEESNKQQKQRNIEQNELETPRSYRERRMSYDPHQLIFEEEYDGQSTPEHVRRTTTTCPPPPPISHEIPAHGETDGNGEAEQLLRRILLNPQKPEEKLPKFSGADEEDFQDFWTKVIRTKKFNGWDDKRTTEALALSFEKRASRFYDSLDYITKTNIKAIERSFREEFKPPEKLWRQRSQLYALRQDNKNLEEYIEQLEILTEGIRLDGETKLDLFINGLNTDLKQHLQLRQPKSYREAVRAARVKESIRKESANNRDEDMKKILELLKSQKVNSELEERIQKLENQKKTTNLAAVNLADPVDAGRAIERLKRENEILRRTRNPRPQPATTQRQFFQTRGMRTTDGQPICFSCGRVGHNARNCQQRMEDPRIPRWNQRNNNFNGRSKNNPNDRSFNQREFSRYPNQYQNSDRRNGYSSKHVNSIHEFEDFNEDVDDDDFYEDCDSFYEDCDDFYEDCDDFYEDYDDFIGINYAADSYEYPNLRFHDEHPNDSNNFERWYYTEDVQHPQQQRQPSLPQQHHQQQQQQQKQQEPQQERQQGRQSSPRKEEDAESYVPKAQPTSIWKHSEDIYRAKRTPPDSGISSNATHAVPSNLILDISIQGHPAKALIDTGASVTAIDQKFIDDINFSKDEIRRPDIFKLSSANGSPMKVSGTAEFCFTIDNNTYKFNAYIINSLQYQVIIGADFLKRFQGVINLRTYTLKLEQDNQEITQEEVGEKIGNLKISKTKQQIGSASSDVFKTKNIHNQKDSKRPLEKEIILNEPKHHPVLSTKKFTLEPKSVNICSFKYKFPSKNDYIFEQNEELLFNHGLIIEPAVLSGAMSKIHLHITNTSQDQQILSLSSIIGNITQINLEDNQDEIPSQSFAASRIETASRELKEDDFNISEDLSDDEKAELMKLLREYRDIFAFEMSELGKTHLVKHVIDTQTVQPIKQRPYRVSPAQRKAIEEEVNKMLQNDVIKHSTSPWASPVLLVPKPDGSMRFCIDFRKLNSVTAKDSYPIPRIDDILDNLNGSAFFSSMDLMCGFWQVEMAEDSKEKTAFVTHDGLFECEKMPMGLTNSPSTFQRLMQEVLRTIIWKGALLFFDDVLGHSKTFSSHLIILRKIFECLRAANLKLKPSKCRFAFSKVEFLGHTVSKQGVQPNNKNTATVKNFPTPSSIKNVRTFLGMCTYYRRFIQNFSSIAAPLYKLLKQGAKFEWTDLQEHAFQCLKQKLTEKPILRFADFNEEFILSTDASNNGLGYTLSQKIEGKEHVVLYGSRQFTDTEKKYSTTEKEALAIVVAVKKCHPYLFGQKFTIVTDHQPLKWLINAKEPTGRLARWAMTLSTYDFSIIYRPGSKNGVADALSRIPDANRNIVEKKIAVTKVDHSSINMNELKKQQRAEEPLRKIILQLEDLNSQTKESKDELDDFKLVDGILYHLPKKATNRDPQQLQLVLPKSYHNDILFWAHDHPIGGHFGLEKTLDKIKKRYYWPHQYTDVSNWIKNCVDCAQKKGNVSRNRAALHPIPAESPWSQVCCDVVGPFPATTAGNKYIIVFQDRFTAWPEAFATASTEAPIVANILLEQIIFRYGSPKTFLTDRGTNFLSSLITELCRVINIKKVNTTAYHPQCNGMTERFNGTLVRSLSMFVSSHQKDWDKYLNSALFAYRTSINSSRGDSPYFLLFGREPTLPPDTCFNVPKELPPSVEAYKENLVKQLKIAHEEAKRHLQKAQLQNELHYDKKAKNREFKVGDLVWVHNKQRKKGLSPKLQCQWHGPYEVISQTSPVNFLVKLTQSNSKPKVIHVNRIKKCHQQSTAQNGEKENNDKPPDEREENNTEEDPIPQQSIPDVEVRSASNKNVPTRNKEDQLEEKEVTQSPDVFYVEEIKAMKYKKKKRFFLVKWQNFDDEDNTWEPEENLHPTLVKDYLEKRKTNEQINSISIDPDPCMVHHKTQNPIKLLIFLLLRLIIIAPWFHSALSMLTPNLGTLFDCERPISQGVYEYPSIPNCYQNIKNHEDAISEFTTKVFRYSPISTKFQMHFCRQHIRTYTCDYRNVFRSPKRSKTSKELKVLPEICLQAINDQVINSTHNGFHKKHKLYQVNPMHWKTKSETYNCVITAAITVFELDFHHRKFTAQIVGNNSHIQQHLTEKDCLITNRMSMNNITYGICKPDPMSIIIWYDPKHDYEEFHSIGEFKVKQSGEYILIPGLNAGGAIQEYLPNNRIMLDNGLILVRGKNTSNHLNHLSNVVKKYSEAVANDVVAPLLQAHIIQTIIIQKQQMAEEWEKACFLQGEITRIQRFMLEVYPQGAAKYIHQEPGITVHVAGDALEVTQCLPVQNYSIHFNRSYENVCYQDFPVKLLGESKFRFFRTSDRQLVMKSAKIPCSKRTPRTYIKDVNGKYHMILANGTILCASIKKETVHTTTTKFKQLLGYSEKLLSKHPKPLDPYSMLNIFTDIQDAMQEVKNLQTEHGDGDVLVGIGKALGKAISETAKGTSSIIRAVGGAIHDVFEGVGDLDEKVVKSLGHAASEVITATGGAVKDATTGFGNFFHGIIGGIGGTIKWGVILLIVGAIVWLLYKNRQNKSRMTKQPPNLAVSNNQGKFITHLESQRIKGTSLPINHVLRGDSIYKHGLQKIVKIYICDEEFLVKAVIDTGSALTIISQNLLSTTGKPFKIQKSKYVESIHTATNETISLRGQINLPLMICNNKIPITMTVAEDIKHDLIIGLDSLIQSNIVLDLANQSIGTQQNMDVIEQVPADTRDFYPRHKLKQCGAIKCNRKAMMVILSFCMISAVFAGLLGYYIHKPLPPKDVPATEAPLVFYGEHATYKFTTQMEMHYTKEIIAMSFRVPMAVSFVIDNHRTVILGFLKKNYTDISSIKSFKTITCQTNQDK